jgi:aryl-alcohol dehydrogenase-like predicted oxidoreductase
MRYRTLGRTGLSVSEIGYGAWGISGAQWLGAQDEESLAALRLAIELGCNFIDTALAYGEGHSEKLTGKAVRESGRQVYVATKVPPKNRLWPARDGIGIEDVFPADYIVSSTECSLKNLRLDAIDLLQLHVWNPEWTGREEWRRALQDLKQAGKVRAIGISLTEHEPDTGLEAIRTGLIDAVQVIYNIFDQKPARNLFPLCLEKNIGVLARVPLDEGGLTGRIDRSTVFPPGDFRNHYFRGGRTGEVADHVNAFCRDLGIGNADVPEVALRFCLAHPAVTTVIPGMRSRRNVELNCQVSGLEPLPEATLGILERHAWDRNFYA